jgi:signal transduction histidine kinase/ActR/RegA family two-component response regulator
METFLRIPVEHFQRLFENAPGSFLILLPDADFTIVGVSENYLRDTLKTREEIIGRPIFAAFPDNPQVDHADATKNLRASLARVIHTKATDIMAIQRYDVLRPNGKDFEKRYWSPVNRPVLTAQGEIDYIIHRVQNVTDYADLVEEKNLQRGASEELSARNQRMEAEIIQRSRELDRVNAELRKANEELKDYAEQARKEAQYKDEFLAMLAHELRNPLAAISSSVELLGVIQDDPAKVTHIRDICRRQLGNLTTLVDDLLDVSRISRGALDLRRAPLDLRDIIQNAVHTVRTPVDQRGISIHTQMASGIYPLLGDSTRLEQALTNLLTNAVKYSEPGGKIDISLSAESTGDAERAVLQVRDYGRGIPPSKLSDIFGMFVQVDTGIDRARGGLGIGLTLVQKLVEMHGGTVEAHSEGLGHGSTFTLRLPLDASVSVPASGKQQEATPLCVNAQGRILIIEDNVDARETLKSLLESYGYRVEVAADGEEGLKRLRTVQPDVAIVDIGLPGLDGYEVARRIRTAPEGRKVKLVALSGYSGAETKAKAINAGFNMHMAKPLHPADLTKILEMPQRAGDTQH